MATKPYLILHRRGDFDGQIAPFLLALNPLAWRLPNQQPRPNRALGRDGAGLSVFDRGTECGQSCVPGAISY